MEDTRSFDYRLHGVGTRLCNKRILPTRNAYDKDPITSIRR